MSVNRAYITSLWTTGILVASSVLLLAVTSAIVAFDGWPGGVSGAPVDQVTVNRVSAPAASLSRGAGGGSAAAAVTPVRVSTAPAATGLSTPVGSAPGDGGSSPSPAPTSTTSSGVAAAGGTGATSRPSAHHDDPRDTGPGQQIRDTGDALGGAVGTLSPAAGQTVVQATGVAADLVDGASGSPPSGGF
jgi:hypothetical protein